MLEQPNRVHLRARIKPELKEALPQLAQAQGVKNPSRFIELLIQRALEAAGQHGTEQQETN